MYSRIIVYFFIPNCYFKVNSYVFRCVLNWKSTWQIKRICSLTNAMKQAKGKHIKRALIRALSDHVTLGIAFPFTI